MDEVLKIEKDLLSDAVNKFSKEMKKELYLKAQIGYRGWGDPKNRANIAKKLYKHIERQKENGGQEADIANLAMMLWFTDLKRRIQ